MQNLSVVIIAQDEERTIGEVLSAAKQVAQEIILVDSGSTDRTKEIAASMGVQAIHQDWLGFAAQKNYALDRASNEWVLSLDADEILTPELIEEISTLMNGDAQSQNTDGFRVARLLVIGTRPIRHGGFYPDAQLRLFKRSKGRFNDRLVHESVKLDGTIRDLQNHLLHRAYVDVDQFKSALDKYARLSAQEALRSGYSKAKLSLFNLYLHPVWTFFYRYFIRCGFLDGAFGLQLNLIYADYVRKKISYLKERVANR